MAVENEEKKILQDSPLISVVIPVYNCGQYLLRAVRSVLNQSYTNFEILVIDDGSDEDMQRILPIFEDHRLSYYRYLSHQNANVARNMGIEKAKGKYIAMLDADDEWLDDHLRDCLQLLQEKNVDGLYGSLIVKSSGKQQLFKAQAVGDSEKMINYLLGHGYGAQTSTLFMTTDSARKTKWDESLKRHQDYDFVVRFATKFHFGVKVNPSVIYHLVMKRSKIDYASCIRFIKRNRRDIQPFLYNQYNGSMYKMLQQGGGGGEYMEYYKKESVRYKHLFSYHQYKAILQPKGKIEEYRCKCSYVWGILFNS